MNDETEFEQVTRQSINEDYGVELTDDQWDYIKVELEDAVAELVEDKLSTLVDEVDEMLEEEEWSSLLRVGDVEHSCACGQKSIYFHGDDIGEFNRKNSEHYNTCPATENSRKLTEMLNAPWWKLFF